MTTHESPSTIAVRVETAARMLDTAPSTVSYWIRTKRLPATKVGRSWRIRVEDIHNLAEAVAS